MQWFEGSISPTQGLRSLKVYKLFEKYFWVRPHIKVLKIIESVSEKVCISFIIPTWIIWKAQVSRYATWLVHVVSAVPRWVFYGHIEKDAMKRKRLYRETLKCWCIWSVDMLMIRWYKLVNALACESSVALIKLPIAALCCHG